jgi:hypothetical protein
VDTWFERTRGTGSVLRKQELERLFSMIVLQQSGRQQGD